jgi:hypothetical protein
MLSRIAVAPMLPQPLAALMLKSRPASLKV